MANISMPYRPEPTPPKITSPVCMLAIGTRPPMPVSDSMAPLTAPHEATVVITVNSAVEARPKRCSLPSMLKPWMPAASIAGVAWLSAIATTTTPITKRISIAE